MVDARVICPSGLPRQKQAMRCSAALRSRGSAPCSATRRAACSTGSCCPLTLTAAAPRRSCPVVLPAMSSPKTRRACALTTTDGSPPSSRQRGSSASRVPAARSLDWLAARLAACSSVLLLLVALLPAPGFTSATSSMSVSRAHSRIAAFCRGSACTLLPMVWPRPERETAAAAAAAAAASAGLVPAPDDVADASSLGSCAMYPISLKNLWLALLLRSRLLSSSRPSCTTTPPSHAPSSRTMLKTLSNAPSNAAIFCTSSFALVSATSSSSASLRITSRSISMSIRRTTPMGLARMALCSLWGQACSSAVSSCTVK
mmetsp:Transcript_33351/g.73739  ORF Transcript_33351/g.73739 Transcript_33351/m.73739 type:complete len:316 (-) Transcript_33351:6-953(-)